MGHKYTTLLFTFVLTLSWQTQAGFILFTDRATFEDAVDTALTLESFEDLNFDDIGVTTSSAYKRIKSTTSLVSEGDSAIAFMEKDEVTISFNHSIFALGFDINELNSASLDYSDSTGRYIEAALEITDVWNESTFFGLISDTALTSFTLSGYGSSGAVYGMDALTYSSAIVAVPTPVTWHLLLAALFSLWFMALANKNSKFNRPKR